MNPDATPFTPGIDNHTEPPSIFGVCQFHKDVPQSSGLTNPQESSSSLHDSMYQEFLKVQQKQVDISEMIMTQQIRSSLPSHKPPMFYGDAMEYSTFMNAFETLIECKVNNSLERLYFLDQYTSGKAKEVIKGCIQMKSKDSYDQAKAQVKKHFGDPFKGANAHINK